MVVCIKVVVFWDVVVCSSGDKCQHSEQGTSLSLAIG